MGLDRLTIAQKIGLIIGLAAVTFIALIGLGLVEERNQLFQNHGKELRSIVETSVSQALAFEAEAKAGNMTRAEAMEAWETSVMTTRYRGSEYLFAFMMDGEAFAHAAKPELKGKNLIDFEDPTGFKLFYEMIKVTQASPEGGTVAYQWPKAGSDDPEPKLSYVMAVKPWNLFVGTGVYIDDINNELVAYALRQSSVAGAILLAMVLFGFAISRGITKPMEALRNAMTQLAGNNLAISIPGINRRDEIGSMAKAVQVFKENAERVSILEKDRAQDAEKAQAERQQFLQEITRNMESSIGRVTGEVETSATSAQNSAADMQHNATETAESAREANHAAQEASQSLQSVAAATEQLTNSIAEIGRQADQSASISRSAASEAADANTKVTSLQTSAERIGEVVSLINDIAEQTNLLALNATIEAARAGEAGKGFAVVASEVKSLANQTGNATQEIAGQISAIQQATKDAADVIGAIVGTIQNIDETTSAIAAAVEEQASATREISNNVEQVSRATDTVTSNIGRVSSAGERSDVTARDLSEVTGNLSQQVSSLRQEIDTFVRKLNEN